MTRFFEKVPFEEFKKYYGDDKELYENYKLPRRATKASAGYDFYAIKGFTIKPGETLKIASCYRSKFPDDEMLLLVVRGSMGFKYNVRMSNQVVVIDADYYGNSKNTGNMFVSLQNEGTEDFVVVEGQAYTQGLFVKYLTVDDDETEGTRDGGFGSTNKKGK